MTLFSPHKKSFYTVKGMGIGNNQMDAGLWNLMSLSSRLLFGYENGQSWDLLDHSFHPKLLLAAEHTILQPIGGMRVYHYMKLDSPWYFYEALRKSDHSHLDADTWHQGGLQGLVKARCYAWEGGRRKLTRDEKDFVLLHSLDYI